MDKEALDNSLAVAKETVGTEDAVAKEAAGKKSVDIEVLSDSQQQAIDNLRQSLSISTLQQATTDAMWSSITDSLWSCILAFENYPFTTTSGLPFTYTFKLNRHGQPGNEIVVSRKEKTITRSSVEKALGVVIGQGEFPVQMSTPKELGVFGASYIYPLFIRFGLVEHIGSNQRGGRRAKDGGPRKGSNRQTLIRIPNALQTVR